MRQVPTYAAAMCAPIIACDLSLPKYFGVAWIIAGKMGAQPRPIKMKAASDVAWPSGRNSMKTPKMIRAWPRRIICVSFSLMLAKPLTARPAVMPIKKRLAKLAAISDESHSTRTSELLAHKPLVFYMVC